MNKKVSSELPDLLGTTTIPLLDNKAFGIVVKRLFTKEDLIA